MIQSPNVILYDAAGTAMAVLDGVAIPASTPALLVAGTDGTNAQYLSVDSTGRPVVVGAGVAGTPAGGVVSIQGVAGGTVVPVSGSFTAPTSSTGTQTNVTSSVTNVTLLAANGSRKGATIYNDSTKKVFVKFGATASNTSFAAKLSAGDYMEVPFGYTGIIDGIWESANGFARVTELT
jgi:hypothetical protein